MNVLRASVFASGETLAAQRAEVLFREQSTRVAVQTDRMFAVLMIVQWIAGVVIALTISPRTWNGAISSVHPHVWQALVRGGAISSLPVLLAIVRPGMASTRYVVAVAQMLWSGLLIHLTGGRIETHFHVFVSLAFLAFYRDWRVLVPATLVVGIDHLARGIMAPETIYGIADASIWRTLEHVVWVVFEDFILVLACVRQVHEMRSLALRQAELEASEQQRHMANKKLQAAHAELEQRVVERTNEIAQRSTELANILDHALDCIFTIDAAGVITSFNPAAEHIFARRRDEAIGRNFIELIVPLENRPEGRQFLKECLEGKDETLGHLFEKPAMRANGTVFPAEFSATRVGTTEPATFTIFLRDITQRRANEEELKRARDAAQSANQAKSAFLANMSHEIRTPMTAIVGYADLMLEPQQTLSDRQDCLQVIRRNAIHLMGLINGILDLSKIEADKMTVERIPVDMLRFVAELMSLVRPRVLEKKLAMKVIFDKEIPKTIKIDPLALKQILMNLLANSVKFTEEGFVRLRISCPGRGAVGQMQFDIEDSGIGMTEQQAGQVFQAFQQADASTTRRFGGTGLGLAISKRLARLLNGDVTVRSKPGEGSVFTVVVDVGSLAGVEMMRDTNEASLKGLVSDEKPMRRVTLRGRILFAEDGPDNQRLISTHLRNAGAEVVIADNGQIAVDLIENEHFDLVLMDMQMPVLDGYNATSKMRRQGHKQPIIALTAHAMSDDRAKCLAAGCSDYLSKPIDRDKLLLVVASYLADVAAAQGARSTGHASAMADDADMAPLIEEYVRGLPEKMGKLAELMDAGMMEDLRRSVHQIKGSGGGYGFGKVTELAATAEQAIKQDAPLELIRRDVDELVAYVRGIRGYDANAETPTAAAPAARTATAA